MTRIAFADFGGKDYTIESVYQRPLGGSHSALCYLAEELVQQGVEVFLLNGTLQSGRSRGVTCLNWNEVPATLLPSLDALIVLSSAGQGVQLRSLLRPQAQLILWCHHAHDQPAIQALHELAERQAYDKIVLVSHWHRDRFCEEFGIEPERTQVMQNAIAPSFQHLFPADKPILPQKARPPILAYTSTPFRGLDLLLNLFPRIRQAVPGTRLQVFSSMQVYQVAPSEDDATYGALYQQCLQTEGVDYIGSIPQSDLARALASVSLLAYPNSFAETSCIAVMEAMASGCFVVTSDLAALPETTAGFAHLIPLQSDWQGYADAFVDQTVQVLQSLTATDATMLETRLRQQIDYIQRCFTWSVRATAWSEWLQALLQETVAIAEEAAVTHFSQQAYQCLVAGNYEQAAHLYEQAIAAEPVARVNGWYLGLALLLQGREEEAQTTWMLAMVEADPDQMEAWTAELVQVLRTEAERQTAIASQQPEQRPIAQEAAWLIRYHLQTIVPDDAANLLHFLQLSLLLDRVVEAELAMLSQLFQNDAVTSRQILQLLSQALETNPAHPLVLSLIEIYRSFSQDLTDLSQLLLMQVAAFLQQRSLPKQVLIPLVEVCWQLEPSNLSILSSLANLYQDVGEYDKSLEAADLLLQQAQRLEDQLTAYHLTIRGLLNTGGKWQQAAAVYQEYQRLLESVMANDAAIAPDYALELMVTTAFPPYFSDDPASTHQFRNRFARFCQTKVAHPSLSKPRSPQVPTPLTDRPLRIGYLSACLYRHSVGWLSRWIFQHHDPEKFHSYVYSLTHQQDNVQEFIAYYATVFRDVSGMPATEIADRIAADQIDILVDLDSITTPISTAVLARKPAAIQVTWLGWDASGLPTIDYFIADRHVVPDTAQAYYAATIWHLPEVYIAVDGFELAVPTLKRTDLNIPADAVIYLSSQTGYKRHPENVRSQLKIIQAVPNSYFLVKALGDRAAVEAFFVEIAAEVGVSRDRLRFLAQVDSEEIHRANLGIADIVLDTYPYNGATTTLEALWREIPLVTRVGEQFASRNSYTFLQSLGITQGIAWTEAEYIEWGIRLGQDATLRQQISQKLQVSKNTAVLWDAKQFTRILEQAYQQMWVRNSVESP